MQFSMRCQWEYIRKLLEKTDGGLDRIVLIRHDEKIRMFLWCSVYILLTVLMFEFCLSSISAYSRFPTTTSITIKEQALSVPSIALCSMNPFKRQELCKDPFAGLCDPGMNFRSAFAQRMASSTNESEDFVEHYTKAFYKVEDLVVSCSLGGQPCESAAKPFFTPVIIEAHLFGQCFCMFCDPGRTYGEALKTRASEPMNALVLQLNSATNEYLPNAEGVGFVFLFHTYRKSAMINRDSVHVGIGERTYLRLETAKTKLLPAPYSSRCGSEWPEEYKDIEEIDDEQYSYGTCMAICVSQQVIRDCKCQKSKQFSQLSVLDNICRGSLKQYRCRMQKLGHPKRYRASCKCPDECLMDSFFVQASRTGFPRSVSKSFRNLTEVVIYQGTSETIIVEERAKYSLSQLIEAIGSNMNTFTGLSFLLIFEFLDVLVAWISYVTGIGSRKEDVSGVKAVL